MVRTLMAEVHGAVTLLSWRRPETNWCIYNERGKTMKWSVKYGWFVVSLCVGILIGGCSTDRPVFDGWVEEPHSITAFILLGVS